MIEIAAVQPNGHEVRPLRKGWGDMHWATTAATCVVPFGLVAMFLLVTNYAPIQAPVEWAGLIMVVTLCLWIVSQRALQAVIQRQMLRSTAGGAAMDWRLDETGLTQSAQLASSRLDWAAIRDVIEEKDRFILLVTPYSNPVLPKRQMTTDQIQAFKALVAEVRASGRLGRVLTKPRTGSKTPAVLPRR